MSATDDYLNAVSRLENALTTISTILSQTKTVTAALSGLASTTKLPTSDRRFGEPTDPGTPKADIVSTALWPGADQIQATLKEWNAARQEVYKTWETVPDDHRSKLPRPTTILPFPD